MTLETITASLAKGYKQLEPDTFQTSAELTTERRTNTSLRDRWFYTSNFAMYTVEKGEAVLYFGGREKNPILKNIDEACNQLINQQNYHVGDDDRQAVIESEHTLRVKLPELELIELDNEFNCFEVETSNYDGLNQSQRALAEMIYGQGDDFIQIMNMFGEAKILKTRIYVLNPDYVNKEVSEGKAIARACWLYYFSNKSNFRADGRGVYINNGLRGVLKVAEGDDSQNLVTLPENQLHKVLEQYVPPVVLEQTKGEISKLYQ